MTKQDDPLWNEYAEAVAGLASLPELLAARRREASAGQDTTLASARATRDVELRRCRDWHAQAKRAVANAEAKLVAAKVLIPDVSQARQLAVAEPESGQSELVKATKPQTLVDQLRQVMREFDDELEALGVATRRSRDAELREEQRLAELAARKQQLKVLGYVLAGAVALLLVLIVAW